MLAMAAAVLADRVTAPTARLTIWCGAIQAPPVPEAVADRAEMAASCCTTASRNPSNPDASRGAGGSCFLPKAVKSSQCEVIA